MNRRYSQVPIHERNAIIGMPIPDAMKKYHLSKSTVRWCMEKHEYTKQYFVKQPNLKKIRAMIKEINKYVIRLIYV